ncbi:hypothetical protein GDO81_027276 [Engystomops pustulosus]|uniref:Uncharacterized protein n=1 Tax=Engystomops pustulosus TaxID=76066 RepID=A0AAV6ZFQ8_ENGPU|nr:hypothetical protein GDO81_027276 [Engystomops pustulosus]
MFRNLQKVKTRPSVSGSWGHKKDKTMDTSWLRLGGPLTCLQQLRHQKVKEDPKPPSLDLPLRSEIAQIFAVTQDQCVTQGGYYMILISRDLIHYQCRV